MSTFSFELLTNIAEGLPVGVRVARVPGGELVFCNRMFQQIMGIGGLEDVAVGEYAAPYGIHDREGALYPEARMPFVRCVRERRLIEVDDIVIHRPDGERVNIRAYARPMFDETGELAYVAIAFIDITAEVRAQQQRKELESRLNHLQKLESVGQLAGGIAHDFNNMLATIKVLASVMRLDEREEVKSDSLAQIEQVVESAIGLTRNLLDFARRREVRRERVQVNDVVASIGALVQRTFPGRIQVVTELASSAGEVLGERARLEQVLMNLLVNARDAIPGEGRITIRTSDVVLEAPDAELRPPLKAGRHLCLEIEDDGEGIDPAILHRVFEPYFTTRNTGADKGTGLGLSIIHGIVTAHGGAIELIPRTKGTLVRVLLPSAEHLAESAPAPVAAAQRPSLVRGTGTVLLVEDEPMLAHASSRALRRVGFEVLQAGNGDEALAIFSANREQVRAIVLDMVMPVRDGKETLRALRSMGAEVPVLITTGSAMDSELCALVQRGRCGLLPKPYGVEQLSSALRELIEAA